MLLKKHLKQSYIIIILRNQQKKPEEECQEKE